MKARTTADDGRVNAAAEARKEDAGVRWRQWV